MKKEMIELFILIILLSACSNLRYCVEKYPENWTAEDICYNTVCKSFNMTYTGSSIIDAEVMCSNNLGAELHIGVWNTNIEECRQVVDVRLKRNWCYNQK